MSSTVSLNCKASKKHKETVPQDTHPCRMAFIMIRKDTCTRNQNRTPFRKGRRGHLRSLAFCQQSSHKPGVVEGVRSFRLETDGHTKNKAVGRPCRLAHRRPQSIKDPLPERTAERGIPSDIMSWEALGEENAFCGWPYQWESDKNKNKQTHGKRHKPTIATW